MCECRGALEVERGQPFKGILGVEARTNVSDGDEHGQETILERKRSSCSLSTAEGRRSPHPTDKDLSALEGCRWRQCGIPPIPHPLGVFCNFLNRRALRAMFCAKIPFFRKLSPKVLQIRNLRSRRNLRPMTECGGFGVSQVRGYRSQGK